MTVRGKTDINPILLKFGVALAFSLAGFLFSRLITRRTRPSPTPPSSHPSGGKDQNEDGLHVIKAASIPCFTASEAHIVDTQEATSVNKVIVENSPSGHPPSCKNSDDEGEFLLPEFNDLGKELDFGVTIVRDSYKKDAETPRSREESPKPYVIPQKDDYEEEIQYLRSKIEKLREREKDLEVQLLEYCGLREQEKAVMELQNRLKITITEMKMLNLKVETLQSENLRLESQVANHANVEAELEAAKAKIQLLQKKLRYEAEQKREQIITLQKRVAKLQEQEMKVAASNKNIQEKLQKLKDLETEAEELRKSNLRLQIDNSELARRLDSTQFLANSVLEEPEVDALKEESERLRQQNEDLMKEIERLQADRCLDVEELVYLRWINACLRYELRNYQPPPGKTVARDLSKSLSPASEKKAKQLIFEYATTDGIGEGGVPIVDSDSDRWSFFSLASFLSDSAECDDYSSVDDSSVAKTNTSSKAKFFRKLRRLLRGKHGHDRRHQEGSDFSHFSPSNVTEDEAGAVGHWNEFAAPTWASRTSFQSQGVTNLKEKRGAMRNSIDVGGSERFIHSMVGSGDFKNRLGSLPDSLDTAKSELVKYAEALKDTSVGASCKLHKRSASYL
ncbi:protein CHUP1, chloroplastic-like isoform X1 [Prosopis cineraria]|uniref:protein CHUP1, chloroplastic-like isoform X1 n=1 Tax=Prosopis cineraria TaxID=364024 RepID=UPI00240FDEA4|nr:protein CHUP1, chloroplastic-like isoform X1 [Prosopis cineraria]XP_054784369.1 protein CHUP1, chloroplastic-like isoform X1 [Prosopis cineraria]XP_054784370.1 protein CHUP1, chloroplastic-like isoform X1 [Prosopis cineraria]XP_054784371.1 protein CHUP1, chloroplastic-like isoform X1 [Prosopis cineraria]